MCTVSITIQWYEANDGRIREDAYIFKTGVKAKDKWHTGDKPRRGEFPDRSPQVRARRATPRLLPTDRIVLDALRAHVPRNKKTTPAVSIRELVEECRISRRQTQICLRRLEEMKIIKRLTEGSSLGTQEGYRYQVSQAMFRRWSKQ